jgi:anti-sigma factor RsiW
MGNLFNRESKYCRSFRDAMDELPVKGNARISVQAWLDELPAAEAKHAGECEACRTALEGFAETRNALARMAVPAAGPWFTSRVMAAITAKEREDAVQDGVWNGVRKLAPRLVAVSALLLVVGGSWALEQSQRDVATADGRGSGDMVFDSSVVPTWYDDGLGTIYEVRP